MLRPNVKYLAFDDRWLFYIGVCVLTILLPLLFFNTTFEEILSYSLLDHVENLFYSVAYWLAYRYTTIEVRKRYNSFEELKKQLWVTAAIIIPLIPIMGFIIDRTFYPLYSLLNADDECQPSYLQGIAATYFLTLTITLLYNTIYFIQQYKNAVVEKNQLQLAHVQGQLDNLRNQINPHFLFNSLNTLMNLIPTDTERAMNYLDKLSKFYRYVVSNRTQTLTSLKAELEVTAVYVDLLKERFQNAIHIQLPKHVPFDAQILPLSLQLLIENAVKHNIVSHKRPLYIDVEIDEVGEYLWVHNNVQKKIQEVSSTGMGLSNIKERFAFFTKAEVEIGEVENRFSVGLPFIHQKITA